MPLRNLAVIVATMLAAATASPAHADEAFYLGAWKLDSAVVAPWADPHDKPDAAAMKALIGKTVALTPTAISGPKVFACKGPHYKVSDFTADMLFQGAFGRNARHRTSRPIRKNSPPPSASPGDVVQDARNRLRDRLAFRRSDDGRSQSRRLRLYI